MIVEVLVVGGDLSVEVIEKGPLIAISLTPGRRIQVKSNETDQPKKVAFDPWAEGHNFGYTRDE